MVPVCGLEYVFPFLIILEPINGFDEISMNIKPFEAALSLYKLLLLKQHQCNFI
jgi:hypothetical protein